MSEYQYYEFLAIDRPLTPKEMSELRSLSSRAEITQTSFRNTYNYGDFRGSPEELMEIFFDAFVYVTNWGYYQFMLRLPLGVISETVLKDYAFEDEDSMKYRTTKRHLLLAWERNDEEGGYWEQGEGWMAKLAPVREELERGDYRALYLGWLAAVDSGTYEIDEGKLFEPPIPEGLGSLTAAQKALVEFLAVDKDLLGAAALASPPVSETKESSRDSMAEWISQVSENEARKILLMMLEGKTIRAERQLRSRYHEFVRLKSSPQEAAGSERRTLANLRVLAKEVLEERKKHEAIARERKKAERERKRRAYLTELSRDFPKLWNEADALALGQSASSYDKARDLLKDIHDAYAQIGREQEFYELFKLFLLKHGRRRALITRLEQVGIKASA